MGRSEYFPQCAGSSSLPRAPTQDPHLNKNGFRTNAPDASTTSTTPVPPATRASLRPWTLALLAALGAMGVLALAYALADTDTFGLSVGGLAWGCRSFAFTLSANGFALADRRARGRFTPWSLPAALIAASGSEIASEMLCWAVRFSLR